MIGLTNGESLGEKARHSSFYLAMRVLPAEQRQALTTIYGYCRAVDDIADEPGNDPASRLRQLQEWREATAAVFAGAPPSELHDLAEVVQRYRLVQRDFDAVLDGMVLDARNAVYRPTWSALEHYCDCVACAVGRLSVRIFGMDEEPGKALAHHLGMALQLTNILRDLDEDAGMGRLYLPREALERAGIAEGGDVLDDPRLPVACAEVAMRAKRHFAEAERIMDAVPRRAVRAPRLMASAYQSVLEQLDASQWYPPRQHVSVDRVRLVGAVLRYGLL